MDFDCAGVDRREKVLPKKRGEAERQQGEADEAAGEDEAMPKRQSQESQVALPKPLEIMLEPLLKAAKKSDAARLARIAACRVMMLILK